MRITFRIVAVQGQYINRALGCFIQPMQCNVSSSDLCLNDLFCSNNVARFLCKLQPRLFKAQFYESMPVSNHYVTLHARYSTVVHGDTPALKTSVEPLFRIEQHDDGVLVMLCRDQCSSCIVFQGSSWAELKRWAFGDSGQSGALDEGWFWREQANNDNATL
jgi:hypothetical protein